MNTKIDRVGYEGNFVALSFDTLMNNAYFFNWTGIVHVQWDQEHLYQVFSGVDLDKMQNGRALMFLDHGEISNVLFLPPEISEFTNRNTSLNNLLLLIRAFEGMGGQPKIAGRATYFVTSNFTDLPNTLRIQANLVTSYSLLADELAIKFRVVNTEWPDVIE